MFYYAIQCSFAKNTFSRRYTPPFSFPLCYNTVIPIL